MDLKVNTVKKIEGSKLPQGIRGVYRGLEHELDSIQEIRVMKVMGKRGIYRGLEYPVDFLIASEAQGERGIYRGVAYGGESLLEEKINGAHQSEPVDPEAEALS